MSKHRPDDRSLPARQVLSRDEIRELLSPLRSESTDDFAPVLVLTDRPEDAENIAKTLKRFEIAHVSASHRFAALDWFRQRRYSAVIASTRSLLIEAQGFVERLREVDPNISVFLICDPEEHSVVEDVRFVHRPLTNRNLEDLARTIAPDSAPQDEAKGESRFDPLASTPLSSRRTMDPVFPQPSGSTVAPSGTPALDPPAAPTPVAQEPPTPAVRPSGSSELRDWDELPDPFAALQCLIEARLAGGGLEAGLRRWIHEDPNVRGLAILTVESPTDLESAGTVGLGSCGFSCQAIATSPEARVEILRSAGAEFAESAFERAESVSIRGSFLVFAVAGKPQIRWAVYAPRIAEASHASERLVAGLARCLHPTGRVQPEASASHPPITTMTGTFEDTDPDLSGWIAAELRSIQKRLEEFDRRLTRRAPDHEALD